MITRWLCLLTLLCLSTLAATAQHQPSAQSQGGRMGLSQPFGFTENLGQLADVEGNPRPDLLFKGEARGVDVYVAATRVSYVFRRVEGDIEKYHKCDGGHPEDDPDYVEPTITTYRVDLELLGANSAPGVMTSDKLDGVSNYYLGHIPNGLLGVRTFRTILLRNVYPQIDMRLKGGEEGMKVDFIVHPGGNPANIRVRYVGSELPVVDAEGALHAVSPLGTIVEEAPLSFQPAPGADPYLAPVPMQANVASRWRVENGIATIEVGAYDRSRPLVIDPTRKWATFYGGGGAETLTGGDITEVDRSGNVLITGATASVNFPTTAGAYRSTNSGFEDCFIVKLKSDGTRLWATYYGGAGSEFAHGIVSDVDRNVFIAGHTLSSNFPCLNAHDSTLSGVRDAICVKLDSNGARQWATLYGGTGLDDSFGFAIDSSGNPAMIGVTSSSASISTPGASQTGIGGGSYDAFLVKFSGAGARLWGTYYGGSGTDCGWAAATDVNDNISIFGWTNSTNLPTQNAWQGANGGQYDLFVAQYNSAGTRRWATYFGGTANEGVEPTVAVYVGFGALASDGEGRVIAASYTSNGTFPVTVGAVQTTFGGGTRDAVAMKFDTNGVLRWSTFLGGSNVDIGQGVASNNSGGVLVTGSTNSTNFPGITADAFATTLNGTQNDAFVVKLNSTGTTRQYVTYYGGTGADEGVGISFDPYGSIVFGGETSSANFPVTTGAFQGTYAGGTDAYLALLCDIESDVIDTSGPTTFCRGDSVRLSVPEGYRSYLWSTGDTLNAITARDTGRYWVTVTNGAGCEATSDTITVRWFDEPEPQLLPAGTQRLCQGDSVLLEVWRRGQRGSRPYALYEWYDGTMTNLIRSGSGPLYQRLWVSTPGTFRIRVIDTTGCIDTSNVVTVTVSPRPAPVTISGDTVACEGTTITLSASRAPVAGETFIWSPTGGNAQSASITTSGTYQLMIATPNCTTRSNSVTVRFNRRPVPAFFGNPSTTFCEGDTVELVANGGLRNYRWSTGDTTLRIRVWQTGTYTLEAYDTNGCRGTYQLSTQAIPKPRPIIGNPGPLCEGDKVTLDPGSQYGSYLWSTGETTPTITVGDSGLYWVQVREVIGNCPGFSDTVRVVVRPRPSVDLTGPISVCVGGEGTYEVPQSPNTTYTWEVRGAGGTILSGQSTTTLNVRWGTSAGSGTVRLTARDTVTLCSRDTLLAVVVGNALSPSISTSRSPNLCPGDSVTLDAGGGYDTYEWVDTRTGAVLGAQQRLTVRDSGTYVVRVRKGQCAGESVGRIVRLVVPPTPTITVVTGDTVVCRGTPVVLDGGSYRSWTWSGPISQTGRRITATDSGSYRVMVVDSNGCIGLSEPITIRWIDPPSPLISGPNRVCIGDTATYSVPAVAGMSYSWTLAPGTGTIIGPNGNATVRVYWASAGSGALSVSQTEIALACTGQSSPYIVSVQDVVVPDISVTGDTLLCDGDSVLLAAPAGYQSYEWTEASGAPIGNGPQIVVTDAGRYRLRVVSGSCSGENEITVSRKGAIVPTITPGPTITICVGDTTAISAPPGFAAYLWSNGELTQTIRVAQPGSYSVRVTDDDGCVGISAPVDVVVGAPPAAVITQFGDSLVAAPAATYQWFYEGTPLPGATGPYYIARTNGHYTVRVTDSLGCAALSSPVEVSAGASATVSLAAFEAAPGERLRIPIVLTSALNLDRNGVTGYTAKLRFNRTILYPMLPAGASSYDGGDRIVTITGTLPTGGPVTGGTTIGEIEFTAALGNVLTTPLKLESIGWTGDTNVTTTLVDGTFSLTGICETGPTRLIDATGATLLRPARPNPASGRTEISYEIVENGIVRLFLVDALGRSTPLVEAISDPGVYVATFDASLLPAGSYICVLQTPTERLTLPLTIVK